MAYPWCTCFYSSRLRTSIASGVPHLAMFFLSTVAASSNDSLTLRSSAPALRSASSSFRAAAALLLDTDAWKRCKNKTSKSDAGFYPL